MMSKINYEHILKKLGKVSRIDLPKIVSAFRKFIALGKGYTTRS
ncbi:hypothetical protein AB1303_05810 [Saccharolobus solfataricus]|uniref:Uncharacterized protein n=1 Tax=Saccharolobus solfataricus (strain 98/2) TaxID=555311 RepID=D0KN92_SACS9|nr:hypothetical protein [Saccharolobus solfataricus]